MRLDPPDSSRVLTEQLQDHVSEHGLFHPVSITLLFAQVVGGKIVSAEEHQVSTLRRPQSHLVVDEVNLQLPAFSSRFPQ